MTPETFVINEKLKNFFKVLSTNKDRQVKDVQISYNSLILAMLGKGIHLNYWGDQVSCVWSAGTAILF